MNTNLIKLSVDTGGANTKYAYMVNDEIFAHQFPTIVMPINKNDEIAEGIRIEYNGQNYLFPNYGTYSLTKNNTKLDEKHYIAVYTAIAKALQKLKVDTTETVLIDLSINIPIVEFKQTDIKEKYINQYKNKLITIKLNNTDYTFKISEVNPYFESQGYLLRHLDSYAKKNVLMIDLGGRNDSFCLFRALKPQSSCSFSGTEGALKCLSSIATELSESGEPYTIQDVKEFKTKEQELIPDKFNEICEKYTRDYLTKIMNKIIGKDINFTTTEVVFTGGGAMLFSTEIQTTFKDTIKHLTISSTDGWADNVKGALRRSYNKA
mgnify:CR=1 FL=1